MSRSLLAKQIKLQKMRSFNSHNIHIEFMSFEQGQDKRV